MDTDIAKLSTSRICTLLRSLTLAASLDFSTRLSREIRTSQNGGAFKICIALMRTLQPFCWKRKFSRLGLLSDCMYNKHMVIQNDYRGTVVQGKFRTTFVKQPPSDNCMRIWYAQFQETVCVFISERMVRITTAIETINPDILRTVWNEFDYRFDVCRITNGAHIEHL